MSIKIEDGIFASPEQIEFVIMGMRNPMNSWSKSDSQVITDDQQVPFAINLGDNDFDLMCRLSKAGPEHRKYLRMLPVWYNITAPLYWWKEFDTYKIGTVANSCSTMHKIAEKEFTMEDFSCEHLLGDEVGGWEHPGKSTYGLMWDIINKLNECRELYLKTKDKKYWWNMIQLLPSSYNQKRSVFMNAEVLLNIYNQRFGHKLDEWREFTFFIEDSPYWDVIEPACVKKVPGKE